MQITVCLCACTEMISLEIYWKWFCCDNSRPKQLRLLVFIAFCSQTPCLYDINAKQGYSLHGILIRNKYFFFLFLLSILNTIHSLVILVFLASRFLPFSSVTNLSVRSLTVWHVCHEVSFKMLFSHRAHNYKVCLQYALSRVFVDQIWSSAQSDQSLRCALNG